MADLVVWERSLNQYSDENKWTIADLARLMALQEQHIDIELLDLSWLKSKTSLLPEIITGKITKNNLASWVMRRKEYKEDTTRPIEDKAIITATIYDMSDDEIIKTFGVRNEQDKQIRRWRFRDVINVYKISKNDHLFLKYLNSVRNLDYITVCNLMNAFLIHDKYFYDILVSLDTFKDLQRYGVVAGIINSLVKKYPCDMDVRLTMAEMGGLTGYRNVPFPGFDPVKSTKNLAEGGQPHGQVGKDWLSIFTAAAKRVKFGQKQKRVEFMTLEEFIASDKGQTSGASSYGKVYYEVDEAEEDKDKKGKFKARKNFLLDLYAPGHLAELTDQHMGEQTSVAFVKPELGKCRIAVTGDLWTYYVMAWLDYLCGHTYTTWEGNTLEEDRLGQTYRMYSMMQGLDETWSLPWDYKVFDNQPTTIECQILLEQYLNDALNNVPEQYKPIVADAIQKTVASLGNTTCVITYESTKHKFKVIGGVQSGIRLTSLLGNYWNMTMSRIARDICDPNEKYLKNTYIRGDDSSVYGQNYFSCLLMRLAYQSINAIGSDAKYGIHYQNTEFLRVWYTNERVYGYPNRAIPGIMQRKPWTNQPWSGDNVIEAVFDSINTIERRKNTKLDHFRTVSAQYWAKSRNMSIRYLELPRNMGGLGLMPWNGYIPDKPYPKLEKPNVHFIVGDNTYQRYVEEYADIATLTKSVATKLQQASMTMKAGTDDIPGINRSYRQQFNNLLKKHGKVVWTHINFQNTNAISGLLNTSYLRKIAKPTDILTFERTAPTSFGSFAHSIPLWTKIQALSKYTDIRPIKKMRELNPTFINALTKIERSGWHRTAALDWLFGTITGLSVGNLHPILYHTVEIATVKAMAQMPKLSRYDMSWAVSKVSLSATEYLKMSTINKRLFRW